MEYCQEDKPSLFAMGSSRDMSVLFFFGVIKGSIPNTVLLDAELAA
jgi:hypothetical protein